MHQHVKPAGCRQSATDVATLTLIADGACLPRYSDGGTDLRMCKRKGKKRSIPSPSRAADLCKNKKAKESCSSCFCALARQDHDDVDIFGRLVARLCSGRRRYRMLEHLTLRATSQLTVCETLMSRIKLCRRGDDVAGRSALCSWGAWVASIADAALTAPLFSFGHFWKEEKKDEGNKVERVWRQTRRKRQAAVLHAAAVYRSTQGLPSVYASRRQSLGICSDRLLFLFPCSLPLHTTSSLEGIEHCMRCCTRDSTARLPRSNTRPQAAGGSVSFGLRGSLWSTKRRNAGAFTASQFAMA
ncbi:hypothetical protein IWZ01DRAFT_22552 [Phyllosticta capitalensis]